MKVKVRHQFKHNGKDVKQGEVLDVPDHVGRTYIEGGHAEEHKDDDSEKQESDPSSGGKKPMQGSGPGGSMH